MDAVLKLITESIEGLEGDDPSKLRLVEYYPRSEEFADLMLSCSISPNDPNDPGGWADQELIDRPSFLMAPAKEYGRGKLEVGGHSQHFLRRFLLELRLYYGELGVPRDEAIAAARLITGRIQRAIIADNKYLRGLKDELGARMMVWNTAVKRVETIPSGSKEETMIKAYMHLSFEVLHEAY